MAPCDNVSCEALTNCVDRDRAAAVKCHHQSGGVIFVDGQSTFYSTVRQALVGRDGRDTLERLHQEREMLFSSQTERSRFLATALAPGLLETSGVSPEVRRVVASMFDQTWFGIGQAGDIVYRTVTGTTPGAPLADLAFQFIFSTVLRRLNELLEDMDCRAMVGSAKDVQVPQPTWMDDLAIPFTSASPAEVVPTAGRAIEAVSRELSTIGIQVNTGQGKSELLPFFRGVGSKEAKQRWCSSDAATFTADFAGGRQVQVSIAPTYIHLGSVVDARAGNLEDIKRRRLLARALHKPLMRLLCNDYLTAREKTDLLIAMPIARFKHGSGLWRLSGDREKEEAHAAYMEMLRKSCRPIVGVSSRGLTDEDVCCALGILSFPELRTVEVLRHAAWIAADESEANRYMWLREGEWQQEAAAAAGCCALAAAALDADPWQTLLQDPSIARPWIRAFVKQCRKAKAARRAALLPQWRAFEAARAAGWNFRGRPELSPAYVCETCGTACDTKAALAAHKAKVHGIAARSTAAAKGTKCEVCRREFWSTARLAHHFRQAERCLVVTEAADLEDQPPTRSSLSFAWPPAANCQGPVPFWAPLRPVPPGSIEVPRASRPWPVLPNVSKGVHSEKLSDFALQLVEFGLSERPREDDLPLSLLAVPPCLRGLITCCLEVAAEYPAPSAGWRTHGSWAYAVKADRAIFRPCGAQPGDKLPEQWAACFS